MENNCFIIDLREPFEYRKLHIKGAINIPHDVFEKHKDFIFSDKKIVIYCDSGGTSLHCSKMLARGGATVYNLVRGIENYNGKYLCHFNWQIRLPTLILKKKFGETYEDI